jgi:hypothetical protein
MIHSRDWLVRKVADAMDVDECKHGMNPEWCAACKNPPRGVTTESVFEAKHGSWCPRCSYPIVPGEEVARLSNEMIVHEECAVGRGR